MVKVKSLRICRVNVRSILSMGRLVELEILSSINDIDILCVTETWLSLERIKEGASVVNIPGFLSPPPLPLFVMIVPTNAEKELLFLYGLV